MKRTKVRLAGKQNPPLLYGIRDTSKQSVHKPLGGGEYATLGALAASSVTNRATRDSVWLILSVHNAGATHVRSETSKPRPKPPPRRPRARVPLRPPRPTDPTARADDILGRSDGADAHPYSRARARHPRRRPLPRRVPGAAAAAAAAAASLHRRARESRVPQTPASARYPSQTPPKPLSRRGFIALGYLGPK